MTPNANEAAARTVKAMKLIAVVSHFAVKHGLDVEEVAQHADARDREMFARLAGVHVPSSETWALVVDSITGARAVVGAP
jgi:hypothetical protein